MEKEIIYSSIRDVTEELWRTTLHRELELSATEERVPEHRPLVVVSVHLSGGWNGSVSVVVSEPTSWEIARLMFPGLPEEALSYELVVDAMRELANMTGGNLKSLLPATSTLSLPEFHVWRSDRYYQQRREPFVELHCTFGDQPYHVVIEKDDSQFTGDAHT